MHGRPDLVAECPGAAVPGKRRGLSPWAAGALAATALLAFYFVLLSVANSRQHAWEQFVGMWYWILALATGFGVQFGLFVYARSYVKGTARAGATAEVAGAGTVSTGSMVACCVHHLSDFLPVLGLSAALVLVDKYRFFLTVLGLLSNLVGITVMLTLIQKNLLYEKRGLMSMVLKGDMHKMRNAVIAISVLIIGIVFFTSCQNKGSSSSDIDGPFPWAQAAGQGGTAGTPIEKTARENSGGGISVVVEPENILPGEPATFRVSMDTHSGSLDFSVKRAAVLRDGAGNEYAPVEWQGAESGGHHVSGKLVFPSLKEDAGSVTLTLKDIGGVPERTFKWR